MAKACHGFGKVPDTSRLSTGEVPKIVDSHVLAPNGFQRRGQVFAEHPVIEVTATRSREKL
jgi:hypothetical protein